MAEHKVTEEIPMDIMTDGTNKKYLHEITRRYPNRNRLTILSAELRKELMSVRFLVCDNILYKEGCAYAE